MQGLNVNLDYTNILIKDSTIFMTMEKVQIDLSFDYDLKTEPVHLSDRGIGHATIQNVKI